MKLSLLLVLTIFFGVRAEAQSGRKAAPVAPPTAQKLYEDTKNYADQRFAELTRQKQPFDDKLYAAILKEQKELAAQKAASLRARTTLAGTDFYYLGEIYRIAEDFPQALQSYHDFLATNPARTDSLTAPARLLIVVLNLRLKQVDAAETAFNEYAREHPHAPHAAPALILANRFAALAKYDKAESYARISLAASEAELAKGLPDGLQNLFLAGVELAQDQLALKQNEAAVATLQGLRQRAYEQYYGMYYAETTAQLVDILLELRRKPDAFKYLDEALQTFPQRFTDPQVQAVGLKLLRRKRQQANLQGDPAPELDVAAWIGQEPVKLADLQGRVVLLDFWATWCGPCIAGFPHLSEVSQKYAARGLTVIGVTRYYGEGDGQDLTPAAELEFVKAFKARHRLPYSLAIADNEKTHRAYAVSGIPMAVLVDRAGKVRFIQVGTGPGAAKEMDAQIEKLLAEDK